MSLILVGVASVSLTIAAIICGIALIAAGYSLGRSK